jgi:hypothetical protein
VLTLILNDLRLLGQDCCLYLSRCFKAFRVKQIRRSLRAINYD